MLAQPNTSGDSVETALESSTLIGDRDVALQDVGLDVSTDVLSDVLGLSDKLSVVADENVGQI